MFYQLVASTTINDPGKVPFFLLVLTSDATDVIAELFVCLGASIPDVRKELGNCLHTLLAIGTLGDPQRHEPYLDTSEDLPCFTIEEAKELQKELAKLLTRKLNSSAHGSEIAKDDRANRFLGRSLRLEVDKATSFRLENSEDVNHGDLSPDTRIILHKLKDALSCNDSAIKKESLSFLLKKMFVCGRGFAQTRSFKGGLIAEPSVEKVHTLFNSLTHSHQLSMLVFLIIVLDSRF